MVKEPGWDVFNRYLEAAGEDWTTRLTNSTEANLDYLRYIQGVLAGLRIAQQIPHNVAALAKVMPKS